MRIQVSFTKKSIDTVAIRMMRFAMNSYFARRSNFFTPVRYALYEFDMAYNG